MDLIYGVVDLIIGNAPFDISTIKSGSKLIGTLRSNDATATRMSLKK